MFPARSPQERTFALEVPRPDADPIVIDCTLLFNGFGDDDEEAGPSR